jgi:hypothetical protein
MLQRKTWPAASFPLSSVVMGFRREEMGSDLTIDICTDIATGQVKIKNFQFVIF